MRTPLVRWGRPGLDYQTGARGGGTQRRSVFIVRLESMASDYCREHTAVEFISEYWSVNTGGDMVLGSIGRVLITMYRHVRIAMYHYPLLPRHNWVAKLVNYLTPSLPIHKKHVTKHKLATQV